MIRIGEVHCEMCGDEFEPEGLPNFEEPNFCSEECRDDWDRREEREAANERAYWDAWQPAPVF